MTQVREIMTTDPVCVDSSDTVAHAARRMAEADVGALPIRGEDNQLKGMLTDRDIVVRVLAEGKDPVALHASELARGDVVTVRPDDDVAHALEVMSRHQVRRLPVVEGQRLVGIVAQADAARRLDEQQVGETVESISRPR